MAPSFTRQLQWLIAIRLVVVTSVMLPYMLVQIAPLDGVVPVGSPAVETPAVGEGSVGEGSVGEGSVGEGTELEGAEESTEAGQQGEPLPAAVGDPDAAQGEAAERDAAGEPEAAGEAGDRGGQPAKAESGAPATALPATGQVVRASGEGVDSRFLVLIALLTYGASLLYILFLKVLSGRDRLQAYLQFAGDLVLVTMLVYFFGGIESPFSIFYLLVIAVATTLLQRRSTGVATVAFVLYAGLLVSLYKGWLPMPDGSALVEGPALLRRLVYNLAIHLFGFYATTFLIWALVRNVARTELELEARTEDLADLEVQYRDVVQSITSGLMTTDREGRINSVNRAGLAILRREEVEQVVGNLLWETGLVTEDQWHSFWQAEAGRGRLSSEIQVFRDRAPISVGYSLAYLRDADDRRTGAIVIFQDLTPWRKLEEEVRLKDRMAAVGNLAAGIAHEIGNPLAAISGSVQMLSRSADPAGPEGKLLSILLKESQRLDRTVKGFLEYARPRPRPRVRCDPGRILEENFALLENSSEVTEGHRLVLELEPLPGDEEGALRLLADPDGISQIFWNLAKNALKAMPDGGTLTISGRPGQDDGRPVYRLAFDDTGKGMTEEERANLFHPFQSFFDSGTGLGMAIVYRIVQDHGGHLSVDSHPTGNTRITVVLPMAGPELGLEVGRDPGTEPAATGSPGEAPARESADDGASAAAGAAAGEAAFGALAGGHPGEVTR